MNEKLRESRFDFSTLSTKNKKTSQGFLRVPGQITRTGILEYRTYDGQIRRELRRPEEVFKADSLDTLKGASITDKHCGMVDPVNVGLLEVGTVGESIEHNDTWVSAQLTIKRKPMIDAINAGDRTELSAGYTCRVDHTPGTYEGEHFDAEQTNIVYNHVGLGPKGWARAGENATIKLDGLDDNAAVSGLDYRLDDHKQEIVMTTKKVALKLDDVTYQVDVEEALATNFEQSIEKMRTDGHEAKSRVGELEGKLAAADKAQGELQAKFDGENNAEKIEAAVSARIALVESAHKIAPEMKFDGMKDREIKIAALGKASWEADHFDGKDDNYVEGVFASTIKQGPQGTGVKTATSEPDKKRNDGGEVKLDSKGARQKMMDTYENAWKGEE